MSCTTSIPRLHSGAISRDLIWSCHIYFHLANNNNSSNNNKWGVDDYNLDDCGELWWSPTSFVITVNFNKERGGGRSEHTVLGQRQVWWYLHLAQHSTLSLFVKPWTRTLPLTEVTSPPLWAYTLQLLVVTHSPKSFSEFYSSFNLLKTRYV